MQRKLCSSACLWAGHRPRSTTLSPCAQISLAKAPECGRSSLLYPPWPRYQSRWWVSHLQDPVWDAFWAAGPSFSWPWRYVMICVPWVPDLQRMLVWHLCLLLQLTQLHRLTLYILEAGTVVLRGRQNGCCGYLHIFLFIGGILSIDNVRCSATCACINGACFQASVLTAACTQPFLTIVLLPGSGQSAAHSTEEWDFTAEPPRGGPILQPPAVAQ